MPWEHNEDAGVHVRFDAESLTHLCCPHLNLLVQERRRTTAQVGDVDHSHTYPAMNTTQLRKAIRAQRRQLSDQTHRLHSHLMSRQANKCKALRTSKRIAFYIANDGEMDPSPLIGNAQKAGKKCYLPVLRARPANSLWFAELDKNKPLIPNRFGIAEPDIRRCSIIPPWGLDLIVLPLVAFDLTGNRLGMGGGYYDRSFAYKHHRSHWKGPKLVGLAHELQCIESLPSNTWDVPLDAVITEKHFYRFT